MDWAPVEEVGMSEGCGEPSVSRRLFRERSSVKDAVRLAEREDKSCKCGPVGSLKEPGGGALLKL